MLKNEGREPSQPHTEHRCLLHGWGHSNFNVKIKARRKKEEREKEKEVRGYKRRTGNGIKERKVFNTTVFNTTYNYTVQI